MLTDLVDVIKEEVQLGEALLRNLFAQQKAVLSWNAVLLLEEMEEKEHLLLLLHTLQDRQQAILGSLPGFPVSPNFSLKDILTKLPPSADAEALSQLQRRAGDVYGRLHAEEKKLISILETLLGHLQEMLQPLAQPVVHLYDKSGTPSQTSPNSGLLRGKA